MLLLNQIPTNPDVAQINEQTVNVGSIVIDATEREAAIIQMIKVDFPLINGANATSTVVVKRKRKYGCQVNSGKKP